MVKDKLFARLHRLKGLFDHGPGHPLHKAIELTGHESLPTIDG
jgi:hypothetical protein